jgi:hypothetical protein
VKFHTGDLVMCCKHWSNEPQEAVVLGCYRDLYTGNDEKNYALEFPDDRQSWFTANQLTLVSPAETGVGVTKLKEWRAAKYARQDAEDAAEARGR